MGARELDRLRRIALALPDVNKVDWNEVAAILEEAYRHVAPKHLVAKLHSS